MAFDNKPIGIGNLTNLRRKKAEAANSSAKKIPNEPVEEAAQLAVDVAETNDELIIVAPLAGVKPEEVRVEITEDVVVIEGEREHPLEIEDDDLLVQECFFGAFSRSIVLPEAVDSKKAKAEFRKNVLVIRIPKLDNVRTRVIKIKKSDD